jgi:hypothetical protein
VVPLRTRHVRETVQQYNAMQIGALEVLAARRLEAAARREETETVRDARIARIDLEELLAGSLDRSRVDAGHAPASPEDAGDASGDGGHR